MSFSVVRPRAGYISFIALEGISSKVGGVSKDLANTAPEAAITIPYADQIVAKQGQDYVDRRTVLPGFTMK